MDRDIYDNSTLGAGEATYDNPSRGAWKGGPADYAMGGASVAGWDSDPTYDAGAEEVGYLSVVPDEVVNDPGVDNPMYWRARQSNAERDPAYMAVTPDWLSEQWDLLLEQPWFTGIMTREEAVAFLDDKPKGAFVVRVSTTQQGHYAISVNQGGLPPTFEHMLILPSYGGKDSIAPGKTLYRLGTFSKNLFNTVPKLVAFYIAHPYIDKHKLHGKVLSEKQPGGVGYMELASTVGVKKAVPDDAAVGYMQLASTAPVSKTGTKSYLDIIKS